ncbi:hypothetical protein HG263_00960 [Pseudoalteromonas sp. JBTF-M23]|uniref:Uncharacterized protein n=1 Tax=Pseudoalteromonas caenipelagi TaxID=2726988 RepID=A0A849VBP7_9GAMM|nr:hypothetical protein [Pseudoalteromonas caenipelagi]NOU49121.1 hypothetical protein [Pseudoalteromonas caenipelagi]
MRKLLVIFLLLAVGCTGLETAKKSKISTDDIKNMRANVHVVGRTSTLEDIHIAYLGKTIPSTYSNGKIGNSRGYNWWVSKHFALKSDLSEKKVRLYLELLEMAYPHYVELFGMEPKNINSQRIAVVYGSSRARLKEAMLDDGFLRGIHKTAGGETMYYNRAGYNFPSHREHHQRYIVIHETMHAFHMALNGHSTWAPNWITEGLADSIASHVYNPDKKQLTVMVFDRAPMNYITTGLEQYEQSNNPSIEQINDDPELKRGLNFFVIHFLMSDPIRQLYFKRYLQELMALNPHSELTLPTANKLLKSTFADWQTLEKQFAQFVENIQPTFNIVSGPWEQDGNAYWLRSDDAKHNHQLDISPSKTAHHPTLDFPKPELPIQIKDTQWLYAAKLELEPSQLKRGEIGLAFYSNGKSIPLTLVGANRFELDLSELGAGKQMLALRPELKKDLSQNNALVFSVRQRNDELLTSVYSQHHHQTLKFKLPSNSAFNDNKVSVLGNGMNHKITPYLHSHKFTLPNLSENNPDPWYFSNTDQFVELLNTCEDALELLNDCRTQLSNLAKKLKTPSEHKELSRQLDILQTQWQPLIKHKEPQAHPSPRYDDSFDGVQMAVKSEDGLTITMSGPYSGETSGTLSVNFYSFKHPEQSRKLWTTQVTIKPYEQKFWFADISNFVQLSEGVIEIQARLDVDGEPLQLSESIVK